MFSRVLANQWGKRRAPVPAEQQKPSGPPVRYLFEAVVKVPIDKWAEFDKDHEHKAGQMLVDVHKAAGLNIQHSSVEVGDKTLTFYNYWSLGLDANALAQGELQMSDDIFWATFDVRVQRHEVKELMTPVADVSLQPLTWTKIGKPQVLRKFVPEKARYMRLTYDVKRTELAEFVARLEGNVEPYGIQQEWMLGDSFLYITGVEGRVVQLWLVPEELDTKKVKHVIDELPWRKDDDGRLLIVNDIVPAFLQTTPFDPVMASIGQLTSNKKPTKQQNGSVQQLEP